MKDIENINPRKEDLKVSVVHFCMLQVMKLKAQGDTWTVELFVTTDSTRPIKWQEGSWLLHFLNWGAEYRSHRDKWEPKQSHLSLFEFESSATSQ